MELEPKEAVAVLLVSDTHVGRKTETYDTDVFQHRMSMLTRCVRRHKRLLSRGRVSLTDTYVVFLGDIVDGEAIYRRQRYEQEINIDDQIDIAVDEFEKLLLEVGATKAYCVPGNHGRSRLDGTGNWDYVFYRLLKEKTGIDMEIGHPDLYIDIDGLTAYAFHGDQIRMYQQIPFYGIMKYVGRQYMIRPFDAAFLGHFHVNAKYVYNGVRIYFNGTLLTDDELSKRYALRSIPEYWFLAVSGKSIIYEASIGMDGGGCI